MDLVSRANAVREKVLMVTLAKPGLANAETVVSQTNAAIESFAPSATLLYVIDSLGGPSRIRVFDRKGRAKGVVPTLQASAVYGASSPRGDDLIYRNVSYLTPGAWYRYDAATGKSTRTALVQTSPVDFGDAEVSRERAESKDGTKIPMNVIRRKRLKLDGTAPPLLTGYRGFKIGVAR